MSLVVATQEQIDYINAANKRIACETLLLETSDSPTWTAGSYTVAMPDNLIRYYSVYQGTTALQEVSAVDYLRVRSGGAITTTRTVYCAIGRTFYLYPAATATTTITVHYAYRPDDLDATSTLELTGYAERLVERMAGAYLLLDDGQPELAQTELVSLAEDTLKLRRRHRRSHGHGSIMRTNKRRARHL